MPYIGDGVFDLDMISYEDPGSPNPIFFSREELRRMGARMVRLEGADYVNFQHAPVWFLDQLFEGEIRPEHMEEMNRA